MQSFIADGMRALSVAITLIVGGNREAYDLTISWIREIRRVADQVEWEQFEEVEK